MAVDPQKNFSKELWETYKSIAIVSQYTPFIISMAAGNLPLETFEGYLYQDVHYLNAYKKTALIAKDRVPDPDEFDTKTKLQTVAEHTQIYIDGFPSVFEEFGLKYNQAHPPPPNDATKSYIEFLITTAEKEKTAFVFAAMTPCERLYTYLGPTIKKALSVEEYNSNRYQWWIRENSRNPPEPNKIRNVMSAKSMEEYLDNLSKGLTDDERNKMKDTYKKGLEHEAKFFLAQPIVDLKVVVPLQNKLKGLKFPVVSDFDVCCKQTSEVDKKKLKDYEKGIADLLQKVEHKEDYYNFADVETAFKSNDVVNFEKTKFPPTARFGTFEDKIISCTSWLVNATKMLGSSAYVISVFWSGAQIIKALTEATVGDKINLSHGNTKDKEVGSSIDKLEAFKKTLQENDNEGDKNWSIYFGKSVGDLPCLLTANIGVVYGSEADLENVVNAGTHFKVSFVSLFKGLIELQKAVSWKTRRGVIYTATSETCWAEMDALMYGSSNYGF